MSCETIRVCVYEPIYGEEPDPVICDAHPDCVGCNWCYEKPKGE